MKRHVRLGLLVPSSNTAVEPLTHLIVSSITLPTITISTHFSRFAVTQISLTPASLAQFHLPPILAAAELLAHARVDVIGWSGTSAGWLGIETDERLCKAIQDATGIPATSSTLGLNKALEVFQVQELGLVTPYLASMNEAIIRNYTAIGVQIDVLREQHLDITDNNAIAQVSDEVLDRMVGAVVKAGARFVTTFCTNLQAARLVKKWEDDYDIVVFDTVSTVLWDMLRITGVAPSMVKGWGKMFEKT